MIGTPARFRLLKYSPRRPCARMAGEQSASRRAQARKVPFRAGGVIKLIADNSCLLLRKNCRKVTRRSFEGEEPEKTTRLVGLLTLNGRTKETKQVVRARRVWPNKKVSRGLELAQKGQC